MMKLNALISVTSLSLLFSSTIFAADLEYVRCLMPGEKAAVTIKQMMCAENGGKVVEEDSVSRSPLEYVRCLMPGEKAAVTIKQMMCAENGGKVVEEDSVSGSPDGWYSPLDPSEISCTIGDVNYTGGVVVAGGKVEPVGGRIGTLRCSLGIGASEKYVPLAKNEFAEGGIVTKDFGVFKAYFSSSLMSPLSTFSLSITDNQKEKLKEFLISDSPLEYVRCLMPGEKAAVTIKQMMCAENGGKVISE